MEHLAKLLEDYDKKNTVKEDYGIDGDDEFEFDLDMDPEDDYDHDEGQPSDYDEWQDYMGGDDWDHGQYDEDLEDDEEFDDDEFDDEDGEDDFDMDDDEEFDDEETDTAARLDDLEDKLNMLLSKFAEVLATDMVDDETEDDLGDDEDDFDMDDDEDDEDLDLDMGDEEDEEDVEEYADSLPSSGNKDDYDNETDDGFRLDYEGNIRDKMRRRRQRRWKDHRIDEFQPDADDSRDIRKHMESLLRTFERYIMKGMEDSPEAARIQKMLKKVETEYPEVAAEVIRDKYGE